MAHYIIENGEIRVIHGNDKRLKKLKETQYVINNKELDMTIINLDQSKALPMMKDLLIRAGIGDFKEIKLIKIAIFLVIGTFLLNSVISILILFNSSEGANNIIQNQVKLENILKDTKPNEEDALKTLENLKG